MKSSRKNKYCPPYSRLIRIDVPLPLAVSTSVLIGTNASQIGWTNEETEEEARVKKRDYSVWDEDWNL